MVVALPRPVGAGLAPGMGDLNAGHCPGGLNRPDDGRKRLGLPVIPQSRVTWGDPAFRGHRRGLGDHQPRSAARQLGQVHVMPFVGQAVDGGVLTHGRHYDAIAQGDVPQLERLEQCTHPSGSNVLEYENSRTPEYLTPAPLEVNPRWST